MEAYNKVQEGDIVLNGLNLSFDFISQRVGLVKEKGVITSAYLTIRPTKTLDSIYLTYLLKAYDCCKAFHGMGRGLRQTLSYKELRYEKLIYPSLAEQKAIADFLDKKCEEIDELVALQEKIIEELKSYKQSVITETVCKGLNPNAPMKDSGVEWIGEIPKDWKVCAIKRLALLKSGDNITSLDISDTNEGYVVYGGNGKRGYYTQYNHEGMYVLVGRQGALCGNINYSEGKFWATDHCVVCTPKTNYNTYWFGETLRACNLNQYSLSSAQPGISVERVKEVLIPTPPFEEQTKIATFLFQKCSEIDQLISIKQQKIVELKEYKKSLIYEYTTGKKEV